MRGAGSVAGPSEARGAGGRPRRRRQLGPAPRGDVRERSRGRSPRLGDDGRGSDQEEREGVRGVFRTCSEFPAEERAGGRSKATEERKRIHTCRKEMLFSCDFGLGFRFVCSPVRLFVFSAMCLFVVLQRWFSGRGPNLSECFFIV